MRGTRNTFIDHGKQNRQNSREKSHNRQHGNTKAQEHKMTKVITEALLKNPSQSRRNSISTYLQPNQRTLYSTISSLLNCIDHHFQINYIDIDTIIELLNFFGYPYTYNKTVFQPVGAQHTWSSCLQMMEFIAEITNYYFQYEMQMEESPGQTHINNIILRAFTNSSDKIIKQYIEDEEKRNQKISDTERGRQQTLQIRLNNRKKEGKSLEDLNIQEEELKYNYSKECELVIEVDQNNEKMRRELEELEQQISDSSVQNDLLIKHLRNLEETIRQQEINPEEARKIEMQIKQYTQKVQDLQNKALDQAKDYQLSQNHLYSQLLSYEGNVREILDVQDKLRNQFEEKNLEVVKPQVEKNLFTDLISANSESPISQLIENMMQVQQVNRMSKNQAFLLTTLQSENKHESNELQELQERANKLERDIMELETENMEFQHKKYQENEQHLQLKKQKQELMNEQRLLKMQENEKQDSAEKCSARLDEIREQVNNQQVQIQDLLHFGKKRQQVLLQQEKNIQQKSLQFEKVIMSKFNHLNECFIITNSEIKSMFSEILEGDDDQNTNYENNEP